MIDSSLIVIEGEVRSPDDTLEVISKTRKDEKGFKSDEKSSNNKAIQINLYVPCVSIYTYRKLCSCSPILRSIMKCLPK